MINSTQIVIPTLVRIKPGALDRLCLYADRAGLRRVVVLASKGLASAIGKDPGQLLKSSAAEVVLNVEVTDNSFELATELFRNLPGRVDAVIGIGGGKALDVAKYVAFLGRLRYYAVPTSLSNDGFCSPQSSLTIGGKRKSLPAALPHGVVVDTAVCLSAPTALWLSGVGDLVAKVTAVADWKLAFHAVGTPVNDFAALLSDATVFQFMASPTRDLEGIRLLATALMLNGIAMEIDGSSRPASGAEHLISHALDAHSARPRLHGLQVGMASYLMCCLQGKGSDRVAGVLQRAGFFDEIRKDPFLKGEWREAVRRAPGLKENFYTVLSSRDCGAEVDRLIDQDEVLAGCFIE